MKSFRRRGRDWTGAPIRQACCRDREANLAPSAGNSIASARSLPANRADLFPIYAGFRYAACPPLPPRARKCPPGARYPASSLKSWIRGWIPAGRVKTQAERWRGEARKVGPHSRFDRVCPKDIVYLAITLDKDSVAGYRPHPAAEILRNRYGDCKDKATLLVSLLRAIGEDGRLVLSGRGPELCDRRIGPRPNSTTRSPPSRPRARLSGRVAGGRPGPLGKLVIFDPTDPVTPWACSAVRIKGDFA